MVDATSMTAARIAEGRRPIRSASAGPEEGEHGLQQEEHQGVADRLDRRGVELLHDVGRQEQRHAPVADRVGGVDQPAGHQTSPDAGQVPEPRLGGPAGLDLDVAMRLGDSSPDQEQDNRGDDRDDERRLPTEARHQHQRDTRGENVTQREERKDNAANADRAGLGRPDFGGVGRADGEFTGPSDTGEESQSGERGDVGGETGQRGRDAVQQNRRPERRLPSPPVRRQSEADGADGVAQQEDRTDVAGLSIGDMQRLLDLRQHQAVDVHRIRVESVAQTRCHGDEERLPERYGGGSGDLDRDAADAQRHA